ncbi:septum site-determining protein MinC [Salimicrobium flavidum]|uniref:Probable septum site-determining protein MinC n=1 Tax=Salimicrobium flavidum TaxID=570947 RepID=A0A1N7II66_9BACI|nr:septum site-determining protein MinC [Salimicrobium flavidum]SIS36651.1 septum site-determining protein MinC [Salimicrobium flavidum]
MNHKQKVMIKGTREGLILHLDDQCDFEEILTELKGKLSEHITTDEAPLIRVSIELGYRYIHPYQEEILKEIVREQQHLVVEEIDSKVMTKEVALEWEKDRDITAISQTLRSGQVIDVKGDLLVIGDVNPGGTVRASGNVFVLGKLFGVAHAGSEGWTRAVIAASYLEPSQLRIADKISRSPDQEEVDGGYMECGFIDETAGAIRIDRLQKVVKWRPELVSLERRMHHG